MKQGIMGRWWSTPKLGETPSWAWIVIVVAATWVVIAVGRLVTYVPDAGVHYHATFAVYINGDRFLFEPDSYYEEMAVCSAAEFDLPQARVHMHRPDNDLIHVHDRAVTWDHFFSNLGWSVSDYTLVTRDQTYQTTDQKQLRFILNGQPLGFLQQRRINNHDSLIVDYGSDPDEVLSQRYQSLDQTKSERANQTQDPASCQGDASTDGGWWPRLRHALNPLALSWDPDNEQRSAPKL